MTFASIWFLSSVLSLHAGGPGLPRLDAAVLSAGSNLHRSSIVVCWDRGACPVPGRDEPSAFLCEDEDEDDTFEDAPLASGHGRDSAAPSIDAAGPCRGRVPACVTSRSASPTVRLRC